MESLRKATLYFLDGFYLFSAGDQTDLLALNERWKHVTDQKDHDFENNITWRLHVDLLKQTTAFMRRRGIISNNNS